MIPPVDNIEEAVSSVMKPFDKNVEEGDVYNKKYLFWDWYVLGGRFAGKKTIARCDRVVLDRFYAWLSDEKITLSGFQCGKQELEPSTQREKVDKKWNEMFPSSTGTLVPCPIFSHSNDPYNRNNNGMIDGDVCSLKDSMNATCSHVIFAGPSYAHETKDYVGPLEVFYMLSRDVWNGVNFMGVDWDGTVGNAVDKCNEYLENRSLPHEVFGLTMDKGITVTVDYHN